MRGRALGLGVAALVLSASASVSAEIRIATVGRGAWSWFADPRAVHVSGRYDKTYIGYIGWHGEVTVAACDPRLGLLRSYVVGYLFHDDHGSPSIVVEPDDRLTIFWSGHNGHDMYHRTTRHPADIRSWGPIRRIRSGLPGRLGFTYPNPMILQGESDKLYLFWRGSDWSQNFATRTRDGRWSPARKLIVTPRQRPYLKADSDGKSTIALAFTDGHPRERASSIYFAEYRHGSMWTASGRWIGRITHGPITPQRADLVYSAPGHAGISAWEWDVALDSRDRPVIVYATFPSVSNHEYWYARFDGRRWVSHFMTFAGPSISPGTIEQQYCAGATLDHSNPSVVYLSRKVGTRFNIERWTRMNGGYSWSHTTVVTDGQDNVRPIVPRGWTRGPMGLVWLRGYYGSYATYRTWISYLR
jgi:hypothetical protein